MFFDVKTRHEKNIRTTKNKREKTNEEPTKAHPNSEGVDRDFSATAEVKPLRSWSDEERRRTDFEIN